MNRSTKGDYDEGKGIGMTEHIIQDTMESGEDHLIKDQWGREYHFRIGAFPYPTGPFIEAVEVKQGTEPVYVFRIESESVDGFFDAEEKLLKKIKRGLNRRYLKKSDGRWWIGAKDMLRGRIDWNDDLSDTEYDKAFFIDGKRITIEEFVAMLEPLEGFHFHLRILSAYDDKA